MTAQPQLVQGCTICGVPSDPESEMREKRVEGEQRSAPAFRQRRAAWRGRRLLVTLGLSKVTRPSPKGGRNPIEGDALASFVAKPRHQGHP